MEDFMPAVIEKTRKKNPQKVKNNNTLQDEVVFVVGNSGKKYTEKEFDEYLRDLARRGSKAWEGIDKQQWLDEMRGRV